MNGAWMQRGWREALLAMVCAGAAGCRHQTRIVTVPLPLPQQIPVDTTATAETPAWVQKVPLQSLPLPAVTVPSKKVKKPRKTIAIAAPAGGGPTAPLQAQASQGQATGIPVLLASGGLSPEANGIGSLTPGGNEAPQLRKEAMELIAALQKRLASLAPELKEKQKEQMVRVLNFHRQAQTALAAGDPDGAVTLATKAKVLLDDLVKQGS